MARRGGRVVCSGLASHRALTEWRSARRRDVRGNRVDSALSLYYRHILEHGQRLTVEQVRDAYRDIWIRDLQAERDQRGIDWDDDLDEQATFHIGLDAIELTFSELVPRIGEPVAVRRKLEFTLGPAVEWTVQCYLDLETLRPDQTGGCVAAIVDYKVKSTGCRPSPRRTA